MTTVLRSDKLEELLVANWTDFIDTTRLMAFVLGVVRDNVGGDDFSIVAQSNMNRKGVQITLSRFRLAESGFMSWADFSVPQGDNIAVGTTELHISPSGMLTHIRTVGSLFVS